MTDLTQPALTPPVVTTHWIIFDDGSVGSVRFEDGTEPVLWAPGRFVAEAEHDAALEVLTAANEAYVAGIVAAEKVQAHDDFKEMRAAGVPERVALRLSGHELDGV